MKLITCRTLIGVFALGLCTLALAEEPREYPQISFVGPGGSKNPISRDQFIVLVVEGPFLSCDTTPIPSAGAVDYINNLLKIKNVSYIGVHTREGVKYGDVVRAIDILRKTNAKSIGVSMIELPVGKEL